MKLEVRCCCDPGKLLGYLDHPNLQRIGDRYTFELRPASCVRVGDDAAHVQFGERIELDVLEALLPIKSGEGIVVGQTPSVFGRESRVAIRNRDYPLETLRRIPGFEEAKDPEAITGHGRY